MDIGEQKRVIVVEPAEQPAPAKPQKQPDKAPARPKKQPAER